MTIYEKAKSLVTAREAAEHYGLMVNRYGMALCPFHDDHNPSMKLDKHFPVSWKSLRILRFAKYKGPEISNIEAHNERTKEKYASNPGVDTNRSKNNFHIIQPTDKYRVMSEALIKQYDCPRVRSDSVRIVETLITASPEFFKGKKKSEIRGFFEHAVDFLKQELGEDRLISASIAQTYLKVMNRFAEQFGLTPASRSRIIADTTGGGSEDELEALLGGDG